MKKLLLTLVVAATMATSAVSAKRPKAHQLTHAYTFAKYVKDFGKKYSASEYVKREPLFRVELQKVLAHNADKTRLWRMGVNHMSDWTVEEKHSTSHGRPKDGHVPDVKHLPGAHKMRESDVPLPYAVDWRLADPPILTSIKDQGMCGTCWAHAATEGIEVANALATGDRLVLSQQQVASCAPSNGWGHGCWGGWAEAGFSWVIETGGINQEWVMGYQSYNGYSPNCSLLPKPQEQVPTQGIIGYNSVPANDADAFADALATIGPLAVSVDADPWTPYESGIFDGCIYNATTSLDHAVQAVGYGTDPALGARYWIIRNSWNALWGEQGYIRLLRQPEGVSEPCGIVNSPTMATNNQNVTVCGMCGVLVQGLYGIAEPVQ